MGMTNCTLFYLSYSKLGTQNNAIFRSFDKMKRFVSSVFQFFLHQNCNAYVIEEGRNVEFSKLSSRVYTISYHIRFP